MSLGDYFNSIFESVNILKIKFIENLEPEDTFTEMHFEHLENNY